MDVDRVTSVPSVSGTVNDIASLSSTVTPSLGLYATPLRTVTWDPVDTSRYNTNSTPYEPTGAQLSASSRSAFTPAKSQIGNWATRQRPPSRQQRRGRRNVVGGGDVGGGQAALAGRVSMGPCPGRRRGMTPRARGPPPWRTGAAPLRALITRSPTCSRYLRLVCGRARLRRGPTPPRL